MSCSPGCCRRTGGLCRVAHVADGDDAKTTGAVQTKGSANDAEDNEERGALHLKTFVVYKWPKEDENTGYCE